MQLKELKEQYDAYRKRLGDISDFDWRKSRKEFLKQNIRIAEHVPFVAKVALITDLAEDLVKEENGHMTVNTIEYEVLKTMSIVNLYTDIEYEIRDSEADDEANEGKYEPIEVYDILSQMGVDQVLLYNEDVAVFLDWLNSSVYGMAEDYNSVGAVFSRRLGAIEDAIVNAVEKLGEMNMDPKMLEEVGKTIEHINGTVNDVRQFSVLKGSNGDAQI